MAKEKDIFTLIKEDNLQAVKEMVKKDPKLVNAMAPKKPADTKGMSPLQVSLCAGWHRDIADFLLDNGADVNYMESDQWKSPQANPVLHDAVSVAIMNSRRFGYENMEDATNENMILRHNKEDADRAYKLLERMIKMGADGNAVDKDNINALGHAVSQAQFCCPETNLQTGKFYTEPHIIPEMIEDFQRIFRLLINSGAKSDTKSNYSHKTTKELFEKHAVWGIVEPVLKEFEKN